MNWTVWVILAVISLAVIRAVFSQKKQKPQTSTLRQTPSNVAVAKRTATPVRYASWVDESEAVTIAGIPVSGGLFYLGQLLPGQVKGTCGNCVVDSGSKVSGSRGDPEGTSLPYWPAYQSISPEARRTYLEWLSGGRSNPHIGIGYVFLYFYGLERRLFVDKAFAEAARISAEVERLVALYGDNRSFGGYADRLLKFVPILSAAALEAPAPVPSPELGNGYDLPEPIKVHLGTKLLSSPALEARDALLWVMASPLTTTRTPVWRCFDELNQLWEIRFAERYPRGLKVTIPKRTLKLSYRSASGGFETSIEPEIAGRKLPDISAITAPLKGLQDLLVTCTEELAPYSRLLGRQPEAKGTVEAILLLPRPLLDQGAGVEVTGRIDRLLAEKNLSVVKTSALLEALQITSLGNGKISAGVCSQIGSFLDKLDIGFEPDRRFSGRSLSADGHAVLFRAPSGGGVDPESPAYQSARSMTEIAALAALSDGQLDPAEYESIKSDIRALAGLEPHEKNRLVAYAIALLKDAPAQQATLNKLKLLDSGAKETVLKSATAAVLADGRTTPEEVRFLERLHKSLGEPTDAVYAALHQGHVVVDQPVTIAPETRASGVPIPAQPEAKAKPTGVRLDQEKIDRIREETLAVSSMLADIFKEDEPLRPAPKPAPNTPSSRKFGGLDPQHSELLEKLLNQPSMARAQFDDAARVSRLLPDGALETINEWAFEKFGEPLVEGDDTLTLAPHLIPELMEPA